MEFRGCKEIEDDILIDFDIPVASYVEHSYIVEHDGYLPTLQMKKYEGEIKTVSDLNTLLKTMGINKTIE